MDFLRRLFGGAKPQPQPPQPAPPALPRVRLDDLRMAIASHGGSNVPRQQQPQPKKKINYVFSPQALRDPEQRAFETYTQQFRHGNIDSTRYNALLKMLGRPELAAKDPRAEGLVADFYRTPLGSAALGTNRSLAGTGEGLAGLYDLVTPGKGNSRAGKFFRKQGEKADEAAKESNKLLYKGGQLATDIITFLAGGAPIVKGATKVNTAAAKMPGAVRIAQLAEALAKQGRTGKAIVAGGKSLAKPGIYTDIIADTALTTGLQANRGNDISKQDVINNALLSSLAGVGLDTAGRAITRGAPVVKSGAQKVARASEGAEVVALRDRNSLLQKSFEQTNDPKLRKQLSKQITNNNAEIRRIKSTKEGGYIAIPDGKDGKRVPSKVEDQIAKSDKMLADVSSNNSVAEAGKPSGFILKETKGRNGVKDTIRVKYQDGKLVKTTQSEPDINSISAQKLEGTQLQQRLVNPPQKVVPNLDQASLSQTSKLPPTSVGSKAGKKTQSLVDGNTDAIEELSTSLKDKQTKEIFKQRTTEYLSSLEAGRINAERRLVDFEASHKLTPDQQVEVIRNVDNPKYNSKDPSVKAASEELRTIFDDAYNYFAGDKGLNMGYQQDYYPRMYKNKNTGQEISGAEFELLQRMSGRQKSRTGAALNEFELITKNPAEALKKYYSSLEKVAAGRKYLDELELNGLVAKSTDGTPIRGMRPIVAEGLQPNNGIYYARKDVANKLNTIFGSREATNMIEEALEKAKGVNSLFQQIVLSGGIPNTPVNAFGIMQVMKESMALHPLKAGKAFYGGLSKNFAKNYFTSRADMMELMAKNGIQVRVQLDDVVKTGRQRIGIAFRDKGVASGINKTWDEITNDSTFNRFMPMLEVQHFENLYKQGIKRGLDADSAAKVAAKSTENFYGKTSMYTAATRSKAADDAAGAFLFAPRFRESMVNFWVKNAQALDPRGTFKNARSKEFRDNIKFLVSSAAVYAAYDAINVSLNDQHLWENPDGKKDKLLIPEGTSDGKTLGIPYLPSIGTVPRNLAGLGANLATGKLEEAGKNLRSFASMPLALGGELMTNENYFGQRIVDEDAPTATRLTQAGAHVVKSYSQPWLRELINTVGGNLPDGAKKSLGIKKKGAFETTSNALEAPIRFYDPQYFKGGKGGSNLTKDQREVLDSLPEAKKSEYEQAIKDGRVAATGKLRADKDDAVAKAKNSMDRVRAKLPSKISSDSEKILTRYARLSTEGKEVFNSNRQKKYDLMKAKYERDTLDGKYNAADKIRVEKTLKRYKVNLDYKQSVIDTYGLTKAEAYALIKRSKNGEKLAEQILAYGDALVKAGVIQKNKFRDTYGKVSFITGRRGSGRRRGRGSRGGGTLDLRLGKTNIETKPYKTGKIAFKIRAPKASSGFVKPKRIRVRV